MPDPNDSKQIADILRGFSTKACEIPDQCRCQGLGCCYGACFAFGRLMDSQLGESADWRIFVSKQKDYWNDGSNLEFAIG